jgi:hypothetical protein
MCNTIDGEIEDIFAKRVLSPVQDPNSAAADERIYNKKLAFWQKWTDASTVAERFDCLKKLRGLGRSLGYNAH